MRGPFAFCVLVVLLFAGRASAAPPDAQKLKERADAAMDAHHYDEAVAAYTQVYELNADPAILYNRGRAHEARSEYPAALDDIEKFATLAPPALRARVPKLDELLADLRARVGTLQLTCNVPGARVLVGGQDLGATPLQPTRLNAGATSLEVIARDRLPYKKEIELRGGETTTVEVSLAPVAGESVVVVRPAPLAPAIAEKPREPQHGRSILASPVFWTIVGVVVAAGATTGIVYAATTERAPDSGAGFTPPRLSGP